MKRRPPPFALLVAVAAFVFAQLMGAAHACEMGSAPASPAKAIAALHAGADCCDQGQPAPDPSCDNHCQQAYKAPEQVQVSSVSPLVLAGHALPPSVSPWAPPPSSSPRTHYLARHAAPPKTIRDCCFRI
jgi:hypothetical protein